MANYKIMPNNLDAEQAVLGCLLIDNECQTELMYQISVEDFYTDAHKNVYEAMQKVFQRSTLPTTSTSSIPRRPPLFAGECRAFRKAFRISLRFFHRLRAFFVKKRFLGRVPSIFGDGASFTHAFGATI